MAGDSTLVLLHPVGLNGGSFEVLGLDAAAPNLLGHGGRPRTRGMTLEDVADDAAAQVPGMLDLAGFSFGGMVAIQVALRHPERVRSLFVACAPATVDTGVILERAKAVEEHGMEGVLDSTLQRWFTPEALADEDHPGVAYARSSLLGLDPLCFADGWRAIAAHNVTARLGELDLPVTCLAGDTDVSAPLAAVRLIADNTKGARYVEVVGPHMAYLENPMAVRAAILEHLSATDAKD